MEGYFFFATDDRGGTLYQCAGSSWVAITGGIRTVVAGPNISVVSTPSQITITGTTPPYTLPVASGSILGGIKVGSGLVIDGSGVLATTITSPLTTKGDLWGFSTVNARLPVGIDGTKLTADSTQPLGVKWGADSTSGSIEFVIFGDGVTIATGISGDLVIPFACTITRVTVLADRTTNAVIDIWKSSYAGYPPTVGNSITGSDQPTLTAATKMQDSTLTGWTTTINAGDILRFNVNSCSAAQRLLINMDVTA